MSEIVGSRSSGSSGPRPKTSSSRSVLDLFLFLKAQRHPLVADDLVDHAGDGLPRLAGVDARQLLQIQLGDQGPMYFRFERLKIQLFHAMPPTILSKTTGLTPLSEQTETLLLFRIGGKPHAALAICRITREIGESSSASGVAVFCACRTAG